MNAAYANFVMNPAASALAVRNARRRRKVKRRSKS